MFPHSQAKGMAMWDRGVRLGDAGVAQSQDEAVDEALVRPMCQRGLHHVSVFAKLLPKSFLRAHKLAIRSNLPHGGDLAAGATRTTTAVARSRTHVAGSRGRHRSPQFVRT